MTTTAGAPLEASHDALDDARLAALLDAPLARLPFPARLESFFVRRAIAKVGELVALLPAELLLERNLGRKSIADAEDLLRAHLGVSWDDARRRSLAARSEAGAAPIPPAAPPVDPPPGAGELPELPDGAHWRDLLRDALKHLPHLERLVLTQRSGIAGPAPTLAEIGEVVGVSRERVRQLEARGLDTIRATPSLAALKARLEAATPADLVLLRRWDPGAPLLTVGDEDEEAFGFLVHDVLRARSVVRVDEHAFLTTLDRRDVERRLAAVREHARALSYPLSRDAQLGAVARGAGLDVEALRLIWPFFADEVESEGDQVTGFGSTKRSAVLAHVRAAPGPVSHRALEERFGRRRLPDELVWVDRGLVTVSEKIADWERWRRRLPPLVRSLVERHGPARQWSTRELVPLLAEEAELPPWMNEWALGSLLRGAPDVRYLGRNVVALNELGSDRLMLHELAAGIVSAQGGPLAEDALLGKIRERRAIAENTWLLLRMRKPFLLFEDDRVGAAPRDVPGGEPAAARACDHVFDVLEVRQRGLTAGELRGALAAAGPPFDGWDLRMTRSLLRHDARFRSAPGGAIGLSEWDDVRSPTQTQILEELLASRHGAVSIDEAIAALPTASGEPLTRSRLGLLASSVGARLAETRVERSPIEDVSAGDSEALARVIAWLPEGTIALFRDAMARATTAAALRPALAAWLERMRAEARASTNVELDQVERLASRAAELLDRDAEVDAESRRIACAAVEYLVAIDDALPDTVVGGLDDDEAVLSAVTSFAP